MQQQQNIFQNNAPTHITNNFSNPAGESATAPVTVKFKEGMKRDLEKFCFENDISRSEFLRDAAQFYRHVFPQKDKFLKYQDAVSALLRSLP